MEKVKPATNLFRIELRIRIISNLKRKSKIKFQIKCVGLSEKISDKDISKTYR